MYTLRARGLSTFLLHVVVVGKEKTAVTWQQPLPFTFLYLLYKLYYSFNVEDKALGKSWNRTILQQKKRLKNKCCAPFSIYLFVSRIWKGS